MSINMLITGKDIIVRIIYVFIVISSLFNLSVYANTDMLTSDDDKLWIQFEEHNNSKIPIVILYEGEELKLLDDYFIRMKSDSQTIDFMVDDFRGTPNSAWSTVLYNSANMNKSKYIYNYTQIKKRIAGKKIFICSFERQNLKYAPNLNTNFVYIDIVVDSKTLVSVYFKSKTHIDIDRCLSKIMFISSKNDDINIIKIGNENIQNDNIKIEFQKPYVRKERNFLHDETKKFYKNELLSENAKFKWGIFDPISIVSFQTVKNMEKKFNFEFDIILEYYDLLTLPKSERISDAYKMGKILELTFQSSEFGNFNIDMMYDILSGKKDIQIEKLLENMKKSDVPILFRLNNEMNGDWCSYNALYYHKDTQVFIEFSHWFRKECEKRDVNNIIWVWNPNWGDFPNVKWNNYMRYFPGVKYVDIIGLTGYNTGTYYKYEKWRNFNEIYTPMINEYDLYLKNYPYIITEFGCADVGGNKKEWIKDALSHIKELPIKGAVWWNWVDIDPSNGKIARKYKFDDEPETLLVFKEYMEEEME